MGNAAGSERALTSGRGLVSLLTRGMGVQVRIIINTIQYQAIRYAIKRKLLGMGDSGAGYPRY